MFSIVSTDGRYHGDVLTENDAEQLEIVQKSKQPGYFRLVEKEQFAKVSESDMAARGQFAKDNGQML